jgi:hypothetical protein
MTKLVAVGLTLAALLLSNGRSASAQSTPGPAGTGHWEGALSVQGKELRLEVELVARSADKWEGSAAFPDMNAKGLMLSAIAVQGQAVTFAIKGVPGDPTFKGTLSKDSKTLSGDFIQGPVAGTFTLAWKGEAKFEAPPKNAPLTKDFEGTWEGTVEVNGNKLRLGLKLANQDGAATGTLIAIDQGGVEIALSEIVQTDAHLKFTVPVIGGTYEGDLKDDQITGTWSQGGGSTPLNLKRAAK